MRGRVAIAALALIAAAPASGRDYGVEGRTWAIAEPDLSDQIDARLRTLDVARLNAALRDRAAAYVDRPPPVPGIVHARETRTWTVDPAIVVSRDIRDHAGRVVAKAGTTVNPLAVKPLSKAIRFIDGDDAGQVAWALAKPTADVLVLVKGSPAALARTHKRRFYVDQRGRLARRFGIAAVPATVAQEGLILRITETPAADAGQDQTGDRR